VPTGIPAGAKVVLADIFTASDSGDTIADVFGFNLPDLS